METVLTIEGSGFPPLSARGCFQQLQGIEQGSFKRTVNGDLHFVGSPQMKYQSVVRCQDKNALVMDGVLKRGQIIKMGCIQPFWQQSQGGDVTLDRPYVPGSVAVMDDQQRSLDFAYKGDQTVVIAQGYKTPVFISYRPYLMMRVMTLMVYTDEWALKGGWELMSQEL